MTDYFCALCSDKFLTEQFNFGHSCRFDFEKGYLCDIHSWSNAVIDPDVLVTKFQDNDWGKAIFLIH